MTIEPPPPGPARPPRRQATLEDVALLTPAVRPLRLRVAGEADASFAFAPGQWVALDLPLPRARLPRPYTLASRPEELPLVPPLCSQLPPIPPPLLGFTGC